MPRVIPAAIHGVGRAQEAAKELAEALGFQSFSFNGDRRIYHAAAVISGNFATVLLAQAAQLLATQGIPLSDARAILAPLAARSIENAALSDPKDVLTGPIARGDRSVIQGHIDAIASAAPELSSLYDSMLASAIALLDPMEQKKD